MDRNAYSYLPNDSIEINNQATEEFDDKLRAVSIRVLVVSLAFYFGFMIMPYLTKLFRIFFPKKNPWKTYEKSSSVTEKDKPINTTTKDTKEKKTK